MPDPSSSQHSHGRSCSLMPFLFVLDRVLYYSSDWPELTEIRLPLAPVAGIKDVSHGTQPSFIFLFYFIFLRLFVCATCMYLLHMHACCSRKSEAVVGSPGTGVVGNRHISAGTNKCS